MTFIMKGTIVRNRWKELLVWYDTNNDTDNNNNNNTNKTNLMNNVYNTHLTNSIIIMILSITR